MFGGCGSRKRLSWIESVSGHSIALVVGGKRRGGNVHPESEFFEITSKRKKISNGVELGANRPLRDTADAEFCCG